MAAICLVLDNPDYNIRIGDKRLYFTDIILGEGYSVRVLKGELKGEPESVYVAVKVLKDKLRTIETLSSKCERF